MLNYSRLDVALELRRVADYFEGLAEERGIALSCAGEGTLKADAMLFQRALSNLVANAVRYADETAGSSCGLNGAPMPGGYRLSIRGRRSRRHSWKSCSIASIAPIRAQRRQSCQWAGAVYRARHHDAARR